MKDFSKEFKEIYEPRFNFMTSDNNINAQLKNGENRLIRAVNDGFIYVIEPLIDAGYNINHQNNEGMTALILSAVNRYSGMMSRLLEYKPDLNLVNQFGDTALHWACMQGSYDCASLLIKEGANVNQQNNFGNTPLHSTVLPMYINRDTIIHICEILLKKGCNINEPNNFGNTPLMFATMLGDITIVKYLIDQGADIHIKNKEDQKAYDFSKEKNNTEIIELLKDR